MAQPHIKVAPIRDLSPSEKLAWEALDLPGADLALNGRDWQLVRSVARAIEQAERRGAESRLPERVCRKTSR
jgi:hypothetical protein